MKALLAAFLIAVAPATPSAQDLIGGLQLTLDGRFRYELDYGAVSEAAEGRWSLEADGIHLDSEPMDKRLLSELEHSDASFKDQLLRIEGDTLVMDRYDARMIFRPMKQ